MRTLVPICGSLPLALSLTLFGGLLNGQSAGKSPSELVELISRPDPYLEAGFVGCGVSLWEERQRAYAAQLTQKGSAAITQLERVFDSLQTRGTESPYFSSASWFFFAYASMLGPTANERLRDMIADPKLVRRQISLERALALSIGLTSYLSSLRKYPVSVFDVCRRGEPRDPLDEFIEAFEQGDLSRLKPVLGPSAMATFGRMLGDQSWTDFHREIWHVPPEGESAVGYSFEVRGRWSEPEIVLEGPSRISRNDGDAPLLAEDFSLVTRFKTGSGNDCGNYSVDFHAVHVGVEVRYQVNNSNLDGLVRLINSCFLQQLLKARDGLLSRARKQALRPLESKRQHGGERRELQRGKPASGHHLLPSEQPTRGPTTA